MKYNFIFFLALNFVFINQPLKAQVVIDWSKQHNDKIIDYLGWNGQYLRATVTENHQFKIQSGGREDVIINYVNWDGSLWSARLHGNNFEHAPNGKWYDSHPDTRIDYLSQDRKKWSATISKNGFILKEKDKNDSAYQSDFLYYITWDGSSWTAELDKPNFIHSPGMIQNHNIQIRSDIQYLTWDHSRWTAKVNASGLFTHTNEIGVSHVDKNIIYLNYDQSIWGAKLNNKIFIHAPGFIPKNKNFGDKVMEVIHGMGLLNGFPEQPNPSTPETIELRGNFVKEENGVLWFRPVDDQGVCTHDLAQIASSSVISRRKISTCLNLGQVRDIYAFTCKKPK